MNEANANSAYLFRWPIGRSGAASGCSVVAVTGVAGKPVFSFGELLVLIDVEGVGQALRAALRTDR